jgi:lysophospholipase L1-like esterase
MVLQTGDSMVGGGLAKALATRFRQDGAAFVHDTWEAASLIAFDNTSHLSDLLEKYDPDLVILTLGSNDVFTPHPEQLAKHIESIARRVGGRTCYWIGPPLWKGDRGLVGVIREHAAPCRFFDSTGLEIPRAGDGVHPTDHGGELWARQFWSFFKEG